MGMDYFCAILCVQVIPRMGKVAVRNGVTCVPALGPSLPAVGAWTKESLLATLPARAVHALDPYLRSATATTLKTTAKIISKQPCYYEIKPRLEKVTLSPRLSMEYSAINIMNLHLYHFQWWLFNFHL